MGKIFILSF